MRRGRRQRRAGAAARHRRPAAARRRAPRSGPAIAGGARAISGSPSSRRSRTPSSATSSAAEGHAAPAPAPTCPTPTARGSARARRPPAPRRCAWTMPGRVERRGHRRAGQTGRPTTKRAPSGSEVMSASVGRMFSAQMTPPCASTICFEMARPRPELLPNWPAGPFGIEAVEDLGQRLFGDAGAGILDHDEHPVLALARPDADRVARPRRTRSRWSRRLTKTCASRGFEPLDLDRVRRAGR